MKKNELDIQREEQSGKKRRLETEKKGSDGIKE